MLFTNVWVGIVLVPLVEIADIPAGWAAVQLKVTPRLALFNVTKAEESPEQIVWLDGEKVTTGDGFTVMLKVWGMPEHPLAVGVTFIVAIIGLELVFVGVNGGMFPVPRAAKPIAGWEFDQE